VHILLHNFYAFCTSPLDQFNIFTGLSVKIHFTLRNSGFHTISQTHNWVHVLQVDTVYLLTRSETGLFLFLRFTEGDRKILRI